MTDTMIAVNYTDFEKSLQELDSSFEQLQNSLAGRTGAYQKGLALLERKIEELHRCSSALMTPIMQVQMARHPQRPYPQDYVQRIFTEFREMHGDRRFGDDGAIFGGFAKLDGKPVMVIGTRKGRALEENLKCNFGSANPEGYRKAWRLMELADKCRCPIVTLVDTPGAYPGIAAEERLIGESLACNLRDMFRLSVPVVCVITGEGGSGGALGLSIGNRVMILENAYYSVITPEGCAAILWKSAEFAAQAAKALHLTSRNLLELGIVDKIVQEPAGGAHRDWEGASELLGAALRESLAELSAQSADELRNGRYDKFRAMGRVLEV